MSGGMTIRCQLQVRKISANDLRLHGTVWCIKAGDF